MEVDHVYELVHHLSERCEFDRTAQLKGLGKVAKAVEKLEWVGEGLDRIEGRLNGSWAAEPSTNEGDEEDAWLVLWIAGTRFNNFVGLGIVISTVVSILTLACLLIYAGRMCRRQKLKGLAQVHTRTEWEQMKGMAQVSLPNCANYPLGFYSRLVTQTESIDQINGRLIRNYNILLSAMAKVQNLYYYRFVCFSSLATF